MDDECLVMGSFEILLIIRKIIKLEKMTDFDRRVRNNILLYLKI